jgi:hypothetical protein
MLRVLLLCACAAAIAPFVHAAPADAPSYRAGFDAATQGMRVRLCLARPHPRMQFAADSAWAMAFISQIKRDSGRKIRAESSGWSADEWNAGECLSYRADLAAIAAAKRADAGWRSGDDLVAAPELWLLRPDVQGEADAQIRVELPSGWSISAPWRELSRDGAKLLFKIPNTPADWAAAIAIGHFDEERIALPGGVLRLTILHGADADQRAKLHAWFDRVAHAVLGAYGRLPLPDVQVLMIPTTAHGQAVLFGQSVRGQGNALQLLVDPSQPAQEFADDWMAVHELSHLMHPYLGDRGSWLAEGLATYYQNVLRARGGLLTPLQAWDRLNEGFARGAKMQGDDTLEQAAMQMHSKHAYQRIYWAGAAFWLTVDRDLRRDSHGKLGLDTALARFRDCCLPAYTEWRPEDFVARLDQLAGTRIIATHYREFAAMRIFPEWKNIYADMGIRDDGTRLHFDDQAPDAAIRDAITTPWKAQP